MSVTRVIHRALSIAAFLLLCLLVTWVATAGRVFAATGTVTWQNATQRVDGTAIGEGELVETQIEYAKCTVSSGTGQWPATIDGTKAVAFPGTTVDITGLAYGTWCFRARHKDSAGLMSDYAGPVWSQYLAPPKPPTLLTVKGIVWEMKMHPVDGPYLARVVGSVDAGKECQGMAPQIGFDIFTVRREDVQLARGVRPSGMLVAQCVIS